jgi:hypothetical protein
MNRLTLNSPKGKLNVFPTNEHEMCCWATPCWLDSNFGGVFVFKGDFESMSLSRWDDLVRQNFQESVLRSATKWLIFSIVGEACASFHAWGSWVPKVGPICPPWSYISDDYIVRLGV